MTVRVFTPTTPQLLDHVRDLMRAFNAWHRERNHEDLHLIDSYFDPAAFATEVAELPGKYAPPRGRLLLATHDGRPAGCVALREVDAVACEMKRMFVYPDLHGHGVGRALGEAVIREARAIGYHSMLLDTSIRQPEAQSLYRALGFRDIEPYYELPQSLRNWLVFMHLPLNPGRSGVTLGVPCGTPERATEAGTFSSAYPVNRDAVNPGGRTDEQD